MVIQNKIICTICIYKLIRVSTFDFPQVRKLTNLLDIVCCHICFVVSSPFYNLFQFSHSNFKIVVGGETGNRDKEKETWHIFSVVEYRVSYFFLGFNLL